MTIEAIAKIVEIASSLLENHVSSGAAKTVYEIEMLAELVQAGKTAYEEQVGKPIDPDLIKPQ